jgi:hypothetical protein
MYAQDYEKALKYSMETIKNLVSHEKPHEVAHIIADAAEEDNKPTVAKYLRMAGEDANHPDHPYVENSIPKFFSAGRFMPNGGSNSHTPGVVLSGVRTIAEMPADDIANIHPLEWSILNTHKNNDMAVTHIMGDEMHNPASYLNLTLKRHGGDYFHLKHSGQPDEHKEDLEKMVDEGIPGAEQALRNLKNVMGIYDND